MRRRITVAAALFVASAALVYQVGCSNNNSSPTSPGGGGGGMGGASVVITIVANTGSQSFSPNPATVGSGQTVAWRNSDTTTHHIVQDGGGFDTGNLAPGAMSAAFNVGAGAMSYHCSIHPSMVGGINGSSGTNPGGPGYIHGQ